MFPSLFMANQTFQNNGQASLLAQQSLLNFSQQNAYQQQTNLNEKFLHNLIQQQNLVSNQSGPANDWVKLLATNSATNQAKLQGMPSHNLPTDLVTVKKQKHQLEESQKSSKLQNLTKSKNQAQLQNNKPKLENEKYKKTDLATNHSILKSNKKPNAPTNSSLFSINDLIGSSESNDNQFKSTDDSANINGIHSMKKEPQNNIYNINQNSHLMMFAAAAAAAMNTNNASENKGSLDPALGYDWISQMNQNQDKKSFNKHRTRPPIINNPITTCTFNEPNKSSQIKSYKQQHLGENFNSKPPLSTCQNLNHDTTDFNKYEDFKDIIIDFNKNEETNLDLTETKIRMPLKYG